VRGGCSGTPEFGEWREGGGHQGRDATTGFGDRRNGQAGKQGSSAHGTWKTGIHGGSVTGNVRGFQRGEGQTGIKDRHPRISAGAK